MSHQLLQCPPDGHRVVMSVNETNEKDLNIDNTHDVMCLKHTNEVVKYYCRTCDSLVCEDCLLFDHPKTLHDINDLSEITPKLVSTKRDQVLLLSFSVIVNNIMASFFVPMPH